MNYIVDNPFFLTIMLNKIISGGQTGVDQAALEAALQWGIPIGGWCPPGRVCETGLIPEKYPLKETPVETSNGAPDVPRSLRTEWNVRSSNATLVLQPTSAPIDKGTGWTIATAIRYTKPYLVADPFEDGAAMSIANWLGNTPCGILNVAGPAESNAPGIGEICFELMTKVLHSVSNGQRPGFHVEKP